MTRFLNSKKDQFIAKLSELPSLEAKDNDLTIRSKFNFSYFDHTQAPSQSFDEWTKEQLRDLLIKIKEFTAKPLDYWRNERVGKGGLKYLQRMAHFRINLLLLNQNMCLIRLNGDAVDWDQKLD